MSPTRNGNNDSQGTRRGAHSRPSASRGQYQQRPRAQAGRRTTPSAGQMNGGGYVNRGPSNVNLGRVSHMNAEDVGFSNQRRGRRAMRGEVRNIGANSTTRESDQSYARRTKGTGFAQGVQRSARAKNVLAIALIVVLVLGVGIGVGVWVFFGSLSSGYSLSRDDTPTSLVKQPANSPYYLVVSADLDKSNGCDTDVDALALVRVDESSKQLTVVSIPTNLSVRLSDGNTHAIKDAVSVGGYTELVSTVATFAGVDVSHFVKADETGIRELVNAMGGVTLNLSEEVDDPYAGYIYIPSGQQTLDGDALMTFLRASNFKEGTTTQMADQGLFFAMVVEYLSKGTSSEVSTRLDGLTGSFQTDWSGESLISVLSAMNGFQATNVLRGSVPGYLNSTSDDALYVVQSDSWTTMMDKVNAGGNPRDGAKGTLSSINPAAYTVTVRNGSGITGGASTIANILSGVGFQVKETGNADSFVYDETLVVYGNDSLENAAEAAVSALGVGRATESGVYYSYATDLLVILGSDWKPTS